MTPPPTRRRPGQATTPDATKTTTAAITPEPTGRVRQKAESPGKDRREWRVRWRREPWSPITPTKSRRFERRVDVDRFVDRLTGPDRPDLGPLSLLDVSWRHVGPWRPEESDR